MEGIIGKLEYNSTEVALFPQSPSKSAATTKLGVNEGIYSKDEEHRISHDCKYCRKYFISKRHLKMHQRINKNEKNSLALYVIKCSYIKVI